MNQEIKAKWVAALRGGEYPQTKGSLRDADGGFCCLGVLCDIYSKEKGIPWRPQFAEDLSGNIFPHDFKFAEQTSLPPEIVVEWAGLSDADPDVRNPDGEGMVNLTELNDTGSSFNEIANLIDRDL